MPCQISSGCWKRRVQEPSREDCSNQRCEPRRPSPCSGLGRVHGVDEKMTVIINMHAGTSASGGNIMMRVIEFDAPDSSLWATARGHADGQQHPD